MDSIARVDFTRRYCFPIISDIRDTRCLHALFQVVGGKHHSAASTDLFIELPFEPLTEWLFFFVSRQTCSSLTAQKPMVVFAFRTYKLKPADSEACAPKSTGHSTLTLSFMRGAAGSPV
jgi:hypothetical protein